MSLNPAHQENGSQYYQSSAVNTCEQPYWLKFGHSTENYSIQRWRIQKKLLVHPETFCIITEPQNIWVKSNWWHSWQQCVWTKSEIITYITLVSLHHHKESRHVWLMRGLISGLSLYHSIQRHQWQVQIFRHQLGYVFQWHVSNQGWNGCERFFWDSRWLSLSATTKWINARPYLVALNRSFKLCNLFRWFRSKPSDNSEFTGASRTLNQYLESWRHSLPIMSATQQPDQFLTLCKSMSDKTPFLEYRRQKERKQVINLVVALVHCVAH